MAYNFLRSDGVTPVNVADAQIDTAQFSIGLLGKNVSDYGLTAARNAVHMLENFASDTAPLNAVAGQLWYDTTNGIQVNNGSGWDGLVVQDGDDILPSNPGVSNVGSAGAQFNTVYASVFDGVATSARYADLAERYASDRNYEAGTVLMLGGEQQVTMSRGQGNLDVFGVVSTNPGLMLNSEAGDDSTHPYVALSGQVPVNVVGIVKKGQRLIASNIDGYAEPISDDQLDSINPLAIIGRALEDKNDGSKGKILVVVGAK